MPHRDIDRGLKITGFYVHGQMKVKPHGITDLCSFECHFWEEAHAVLFAKIVEKNKGMVNVSVERVVRQTELVLDRVQVYPRHS